MYGKHYLQHCTNHPHKNAMHARDQFTLRSLTNIIVLDNHYNNMLYKLNLVSLWNNSVQLINKDNGRGILLSSSKTTLGP